jgi:8-oxo-dGTP pyrophosphatase MutT (NUDIX family)
MKNYIQQIRSKLGSDQFIHPAARIIVENNIGQILIIERVDNGQVGIPAGALEENETIEACIIREVKEETGLTIVDLEVIGISSNPTTESVEYPNGDKIQYFTVEFYSKSWSGAIKVEDTEEVKKAQFMDISIISQLPKNELSTFESLKYYQKNQKIMVR